jgi:hypothetical protein
LDNRIMKRYVSLDKRRRKLDAELKTVKTQLQELEPTVLEQMTKAETKKLSINGVLLYIKRQIWAKALENKQDTIAAIKEHMPEYIGENYNSNSLSAWLREVEDTMGDVKLISCATLAELEAQGIQLPAPLIPLKHALGVSEVFSVETRLS